MKKHVNRGRGGGDKSQEHEVQIGEVKSKTKYKTHKNIQVSEGTLTSEDTIHRNM